MSSWRAARSSPTSARDIVLVDGDTRIPWMEGMTCTFRSAQSTDGGTCELVAGGGMRAYFEKPGTYEIVVGPLRGFRQPDPFLVTIAEGAGSPVVVDLTR